MPTLNIVDLTDISSGASRSPLTENVAIDVVLLQLLKLGVITQGQPLSELGISKLRFTEAKPFTRPEKGVVFVGNLVDNTPVTRMSATLVVLTDKARQEYAEAQTELTGDPPKVGSFLGSAAAATVDDAGTTSYFVIEVLKLVTGKAGIVRATQARSHLLTLSQTTQVPDELRSSVKAQNDISTRVEESKQRDRDIRNLSETSPGNYIVRYFDPVDHSEKFRFATQSESDVITAKVALDGLPIDAVDAVASNKTFSFDAVNLAVLRTDISKRLLIAVTPDLPAQDAASLDVFDKHLPAQVTTFDGPIDLDDPYIKEAVEKAHGYVGFIYPDGAFRKQAVVSLVSNNARLQYNQQLIADATGIKRGRQIAREAERINAVAKRGNIIRGIKPKADTVAVIKIVKPKNAGGSFPGTTTDYEGSLPLIDIETNKDGLYTVLFETDNFILQSVDEVDAEKIQVVETFGDPIAFFYGRRPRFYQFTGTLMNTSDYLWRDNFKIAYDTWLRGTKCVEQGARAYVAFDFTIKEGFIVNAVIGQAQSPNNMVSLSFQMYVTREINTQGAEALSRNTPSSNAITTSSSIPFNESLRSQNTRAVIEDTDQARAS